MMKEVYIDNILVNIPVDFDPQDGELQSYVDRGRKKYGSTLQSITITTYSDAPDEIGIDYDIGERKFQRLRRITGYLVGTLDRWNDGKRAEEHDRVKHETSMGG